MELKVNDLWQPQKPDGKWVSNTTVTDPGKEVGGWVPVLFTYQVIIVPDSCIFPPLINLGWITWQHFHWEMWRKEGRKATQSTAWRLTVGCVTVGTRHTLCRLYGLLPTSPVLLHPTGRALISDWSVDSFIMVVFQELLFSCTLDKKFWLKLKKTTTNSLIRQVYKGGPVRSDCRVYKITAIYNVDSSSGVIRKQQKKRVRLVLYSQ